MLVYFVRWFVQSELSKGKGRAKFNDSEVSFTVLCRNNKDALTCLDYVFKQEMKGSVFTIEDGEVRIIRTKLDSRCFTAQWLQMDGIAEPLSLSDLKSNQIRLSRIFR